MLYYLGKFFQLNGLVLLAFGLFWGAVRDDMKGELAFLAAGVLIFLTGRLLEQRGAGGK